jgi:hypothetical protein
MEIIRTIMNKKYNKKIIPLFMFVDYDNCLDKRFLKVYIPNPGRRNTKKVINYSIPNEQKDDAIFAVKLPSIDIISYWKNEFLESIMNFAIIVSKYDKDEYEKIKSRIQLVQNIIDTTYRKATTFASFNELFIQEILINQCDCGILFLEGLEFQNSSKNELLELEMKKEQINKTFNEALTYFFNDGLTTSFSPRENKKSLVWKYRLLCGKRCSEKSICFDCCKADYLITNVIADYLLDYIKINKIGGVGYYKQFEAICVSEYILNKIYGIDSGPEFLSSTTVNVLDYYNKECIAVIEREFNRMNYDYNDFYKSSQDSHCSILFHASILGFRKTLECIKKEIN